MDARSDWALADLLPHGPGFILLDRLVDFGPEHASCALTVRPDSRYAEPGRGVPGYVGIEYMAQTIGAFVGLRRRQAGAPIQVLLLLGTREYRCQRPWFAPGTTLTVRATEQVRGADGVAVFGCELRDDAAVLALADIKAYEPDDIEGYLDALAREAP